MVETLIHVAVCPQPGLDEARLAQAAVLLNKDVLTLRMLLSAPIPRLAAHFQAAAEADAVVSKLQALGLKAFSCLDSELRKESSALLANNLAQIDSDFVFNSRSGASLALPSSGVFLVVEGLRYNVQERETSKTSFKINLTATVLSGGIPFFKKVEQKSKEQTSTSEYVVRLYTRDDPEAKVEIRQRDFDFSFLGSRVAPSSQANLFLAVQELIRFFPAALFDARLTRPLASPSATSLGWDSFNVNCKLVWWEHRL